MRKEIWILLVFELMLRPSLKLLLLVEWGKNLTPGEHVIFCTVRQSQQITKVHLPSKVPNTDDGTICCKHRSKSYLIRPRVPSSRGLLPLASYPRALRFHRCTTFSMIERILTGHFCEWSESPGSLPPSRSTSGSEALSSSIRCLQRPSC